VLVAMLGSLLLLAPVTADAAPSLVAPAADAAFTTSRPTFAWSLAPATTATKVEVAAASTPAADGSLPAPAWTSALAASATRARVGLAEQLYAGRWYWHVLGSDGWSDVRGFTISPVLLRPTLRFANSRRGADGTIRLKSNTRAVKVNVRIKDGRNVCLNRTFTAPRRRASLHRWDVYRVYCFPRGGVEAGTRMSVAVTVRSGALVRRAATSYVVG
jgi:hypothetical protein